MRTLNFGSAGRVSAFLGTVTLLVALVGGATRGARAEPPPAKPPSASKIVEKSPAVCAQVTASAPSQGIGYKHVVTLRNGCDKPVVCEVWTDVDPTPRHTLRAGKGETAEVITRVGSPATEFKAFKECRFL